MIEHSTHSLADAAQQSAPHTRRWVYALLIGSAAVYSAISIATVQPLLSANDRARWCTVWSLVERGTYQIDEINADRRWQTIDRVTIDGHLYATKPPLLPTLAAGIYWALANVTGLNLYDDTATVTRWMLAIMNLVPFTVALVLIAGMVVRYAQRDFTRYFVVATAGWGTLLTTFNVTFNNHTPAALSVIFALYPAMRILIDDARGGWYYAAAGFFAAFAATCELPAALLAAVLFLMLLFRSPRSTLVYFVPAALVPTVAFFGTNYLVMGSWRPAYAKFGTDAYLKNPDGTLTYWANPRGIDKGGDAPLIYLLHCTIGHHGIWSLSPVFLVSIAGWSTLRKWHCGLRIFGWLGLGLTVAVLGFYLSRTENYNYGGLTCGLRWTFWLIPFWLLAMIPAVDRFGLRPSIKAAAIVCLAISIFSAIFPRENPWRHPWLFQLMERWEWIDYGGPTKPDTGAPRHARVQNGENGVTLPRIGATNPPLPRTSIPSRLT